MPEDNFKLEQTQEPFWQAAFFFKYKRMVMCYYGQAARKIKGRGGNILFIIYINHLFKILDNRFLLIFWKHLSFYAIALAHNVHLQVTNFKNIPKNHYNVTCNMQKG